MVYPAPHKHSITIQSQREMDKPSACDRCRDFNSEHHTLTCLNSPNGHKKEFIMGRASLLSSLLSQVNADQTLPLADSSGKCIFGKQLLPPVENFNGCNKVEMLKINLTLGRSRTNWTSTLFLYYTVCLWTIGYVIFALAVENLNLVRSRSRSRVISPSGFWYPVSRIWKNRKMKCT